MNPHGTGLVKLVSDGQNRDPYWSADGTKLAFDAVRRGEPDSELFRANADGSGVVQLTHNRFFDELPRWSPDGGTIVFDSFRHGNFDLYLKDLGSGRVTRSPPTPPTTGWASSRRMAQRWCSTAPARGTVTSG